jgi:hypothetical protein
MVQELKVFGGREAMSVSLEIEHRIASNLENAKTLYLLAFSGVQGPKYTAVFLNRVSQVRILPRAPNIAFPLCSLTFWE